MEPDDIIIRNGVLHILDGTVGVPVISHSLLELNPELNDFLRSHIYKIASGDERKNCCFNRDESQIYQSLTDFNEENLISVSRGIAEYLYTIMNQNITIPSADVFFVTYQCYSEYYLAILKMNYKEFYVHYTNDTEEGNVNHIMKQTAALPSSGTKLSEAALIKLADYSLQVVERKYEINGEKVNYFSQIFLQCSSALSEKSKLSIVTKAVEQINKKFFEDDTLKKMEVKSMIHNDILEQGAIIPETIGEKLYGNIPEIKEEFNEKLDKYNLVTEEVKPQHKATTKKFEKQYLTTDSGIEINIPMEEYNNRQNIEFITNPDGTISVLIKNINHLTAK